MGKAIGSGRVAHDIDEPVDRVQTAEQIIVLPIAARQERREMGKADALEAGDALETLERTSVLRADAVDQDLVELVHLLRADDREGQHIPERKAEIIDQTFPARFGMPSGGVELRPQVVEVALASVKLYTRSA